MLFGDVLANVSSFTISTADNIQHKIKNNLITRWTLRCLGIPHIGLRLRANAILRFLEPNKTDVVLDAGCGMGLYLLTFAKMIDKGYGVDINDSKIEEAKRLARELSLNNIIFQSSDIAHLNFPDSFFNKIICSDVLEHLPQDERVIRELFRMLKKGGILVVSTTSLSIINQKYEEKFHHERVGYSLEQIKTLFINSGFCIEEVLPYCLFFGQISWKLNRKLLSRPFLNVMTFYPLLLIVGMDRFLLRKSDSGCIGYILKLKKN